jgi:hypothetical protein
MFRKMITLSALAVLALVPASVAGQMDEKDIVETAVEAGSFTTLVAALEAADLVSVLQGEGPFTVFLRSHRRGLRKAPCRHRGGAVG